MLCELEFLEHSLAYSDQGFSMHYGGQENKIQTDKNDCSISATDRIVDERTLESTTKCLKSISQKQKIDEFQVDALEVGILNVSFGSCDSLELVDLPYNISTDQSIVSPGKNKDSIVIKTPNNYVSFVFRYKHEYENSS